MTQIPDQKWTAPTGVGLLRRTGTERIVTLPNGERVRVTTEGNDTDGWVQHQEHDDFMDAIAIPKTVCYRMRKV